MVHKKKDPGRSYSPARKALSRSGLGLCRSPRRRLNSSICKKSVPAARPGTRPGTRPAGSVGGLSKGSSANMKVVVRVRPLSERETTNNARVIVDVVDEKMVVFDPKREEESFFFHGAKQTGRDMLKKQNKNTQYLFDRVFGSEATNEEVFEGSTKSIVTSVLDGYNCSVFVYGATGAGKTFTMLGSQTNPGITYRTMVDLFKQIECQKVEKEFDIGVSYLEVYNETVRDLLNSSSAVLHLREDGGGVVAAGLKMERISDPGRMFELLAFGNQNRTQHPTDANAESSRSHAVFQVFIKMKTKANSQTKMVKLSMIDLAGSERGAATGCSGVRFKEGSNINKSLLALGNCINALADGLKHVPYRDSKLTRLLKDSLGGNCQTVMIANVAPAHYTYEDTHNTLKYATRAKSIKFQLKRNIVAVELHVSHYIKMVDDLQVENARLKKELEESRALIPPSSSTQQPEVSPPLAAASQSHLPPLVAAAVAAINDKSKAAVSTGSVGVNTSPFKGLIRNEDLQKLKNEAERLYGVKAKLHQRYLSMDSSDKVLRWRIKMKQRTIDRVQAMSSTPTRTDTAQIKVDKSVHQFKGRLLSVNECQEVVSVEENEINERLVQIRDELQRLGLFEEVVPHLHAFELQFLNQELVLKCQHLEKLVEYLDTEFESHDEVLKNVSALFRKYYNLVRGHGHMNKDIMKEHETVMRGLEGIKSVQWRQERDEVFFTDNLNEAGRVSHSSGHSGKFMVKEEAAPSSNLEVISDLPTVVAVKAPEAQPPPQVMGTAFLLQSSICLSSSNPSILSQNMDTAAMIDTLGDLDSKVDNILNTSVTSTPVEVDFQVDNLPCPIAKDRPLNVTLGADDGLNSTFTKGSPENKINLNETFEKPEESGRFLPEVGAENLNSTFSLEDHSQRSDVMKSTEPEAKETAVEQQMSPFLHHATSDGYSNLRTLTSPSLYNGSPLLMAPRISSPKVTASINQAKRSPLSGSTSSGKIRTAVSSPSCIPAPNFTSSQKLVSSVPPSKTVTASSFGTFAAPTAMSTKSVTLKRHVGPPGIIDKNKAFSSSLVSTKPAKTIVNINSKLGGPTRKLNLNSTSKVKLAWNKENRNANTVTPLKLAKSKPTKFGTKPVSSSSATSIPLNDTFTKV